MFVYNEPTSITKLMFNGHCINKFLFMYVLIVTKIIKMCIGRPGNLKVE